jgi:formylglycine-generating enzyme
VSETGHSTLRWVLLAKAGAGVVLTLGFFAGWWLRANGLTFDEAREELTRSKGDPPRFEWKSVDKKHWQAQSGATIEPLASIDAREGNNAGCPAGMVRVKGNFRRELHGEATGEIERLQDAACTDWISRDFPARCRTFDREKIAQEAAKLPTKEMDYCIDRFEYPNVLGANPMIVVTFHEAEALCKKDSKRLCNENEWTFACEGEEARPYPYGFTRDTTACVMDRNWRPFKEGALQPRDGDGAKEELDRLWQAEPSGSRAGCKSPFGVYDLTGNVDEWTRSVNQTGYRSVLKGGYWGPVRARCRPSTRAHNEDFVAYQQSFRCCGDSNASVPAPPPAPPVAVLVDAGPVPQTLTGPDAGDMVATSTSTSTDNEAEWRGSHAPDDDDDELGAIKRARVNLCASSPGDKPTSPFAVVAALGLGAIASSRRRRPIT